MDKCWALTLCGSALVPLESIGIFFGAQNGKTFFSDRPIAPPPLHFKKYCVTILDPNSFTSTNFSKTSI